MAADTPDAATRLHGGRLVANALQAHGVSTLFTLSGGHLFSIYDGCRTEGIELVDVRHEQTAGFAAEGWAKVTRSLGVCAVTAGPGVTNAISAIASAAKNNSPILVLGGRAPHLRWGQGSLQELDHVPFVSPLVKLALTPRDTAQIPGMIEAAIRTALTPPCGPTFLDFSLDHVFMEAERSAPPAPLPEPWLGPGADAAAVEGAAALLADAKHPVVMAGTGLYWGRGERELRALVETLRIPVFLNGLGRGCLPADHELFFSRARGAGLSGADVALVIGVPLDFRLGFGAAFAPEAQIIVIDVAGPARTHPRAVSAELYGGLPATLEALRERVEPAVAAESSFPAGARTGGGERGEWIRSLRRIEHEARAAEVPALEDPRAPLHPMRVYGELARLLHRDAIVIGDGGDFVSFAGRLIDSFAPGCWLDPGPFGCLGSGPGYALAAKLACPER